jgi:hypothetical protein
MLRNKKLLTLLTLIMVGLMAYAGVRPKGYRLKNDVSWIEARGGLRFGKMGIAFTEQPGAGVRLPDSLTIDLMLEVPIHQRLASRTILSLWGNDSPESVELLQWKNHLIVQKQVSQFFRDKGFRVGAEVESGKIHLVSITSCPNAGTTIYVDGTPRSSAVFSLTGQNNPLNRLVVGNTGCAQSPWQGEVYFLSMCKKVFSASDEDARYRQWIQSGSVPISQEAIAIYPFDERSGIIAHDKISSFGDLHLPANLSIPRKVILTMPWKNFRFNRSFVSDATINFIGFIPFGFLFFGLLLCRDGFLRRHAFLICLLAGTFFSLFIELAQVFIPTRDSQMSDLLLNSLGTLAGILLYKIALRQ